MSDNAFLRLDGLKAALSRVKTKVDSDIASAISESTISLTSLISSGDSSTLTNAKSYIDGIKTNLDSTIASNLATAKGYTDGAKTALETNITNHKNDTSNPHNVTAAQVGAAASSHTHTESDITDLGNYANASHTHTVSDLTDASTELAAKSHTHTEADITDLGNYSVTGHSHTVSDITDASTELASKSHTHTESDITDLGDYATNTNLNSYGVKSLSFDNSTGILTLTMKDDSTKTVTIQVSSSGSGSSSGSSITISSASYDDTTNNIVFTMSDNSTVNCSLNDLLDQVLTFEEGLKTFEYNSDWEDQMTGTGTELDPYLIYTPKDFMSINNDMNGHYKLMNNLDFSNLCGISIETDDENNSYTSTTVDDTAPLYNNGEGYFPIGYDGYFPLNGSEKSTSNFDSSTATSNYEIRSTNATSQYYIFTGELDGNSKVIKGIRSCPYNAYSVGLFSFAGNGAYIHNLTIKDSVFIVTDCYITSYKVSSIGSVVGCITYINNSSQIADRVTIHNVYSYASLVSGRITNGYCFIGGIFAKIRDDNPPAYDVHQCSFRGKIIIKTPEINNDIAGIGNYRSYGNSSNRITNCINTANLKNGLNYTQGIGQNLGKVNINCGLIQKYGGEAYSLSGHANTGYVNGKQFSIRDNLQYDSRTSESTNNSYNYYFKTATEIKSRDFIIEANILSGSKVFIYNDLGIDNDWPLLVDEYKQYINYDLDLDLAIVDKTNNKVYSSGLTINDISTVGHSHTANDITDASSTFAAKSHTHTTSEITNFGNYANVSHTHTESDITNLGNYATNTDLNSYGVKSISYTSNILTLTMKDNSTKTVTIQASGESGSSGSENTSINNGIQYSDVSSTNYNNEWVDRITGTGTQADPYLIYTPKDFMKINDDMTAHYKLMNNLDFAPVIGIMIETSGNSYTSTTVNDTAPLYNNGEGYFPIGYNGYYPLNNSSGEMNSTQHFDSLTNPERVAYNATTYSYNTVYKYGFFGELDGNNKIIKGITCAPADTYSVGLFHFLGNRAYIHNLTIKDSVFILKGNLAPNNGYSSIGTLAGFVIRDKNSNTFTINDVYTYATLINHETKLGSSSYSYTNGLCGRVLTNLGINYSINRCANHSTFVLIIPNVTHITCGIFLYESDMNGKITNCINTSSFSGYNAHGIGNIAGKVNINCGTITGSNETRPIVKTKNISYTDGKQFVNRSMESYDFYTNETQANQYNIYYKTTAELKSQEFIDEVNALLPEPVFAYNDLNVNDGWPLLINEYNSIVGVDGNLNISLVDPINNKIYKSGYSLERLQKLVTYREATSFLNGQFDSSFNTRLSTLKCVSLTIETSEWTAEEDNGTATGNYLATKTVTGITATSPVQMISQLESEIKINSISTDSVTFIATSQPDSNINISIMFT